MVKKRNNYGSLRNLVDEPQLYLVFGADKLIWVLQHASAQVLPNTFISF